MKVAVLSGPVHGGKTTLLRRATSSWAARGLRCAGFLSPAVTDDAGEGGYDLVEFATGRRRPYLRRHGPDGAERVGPFVFVPETLARAREIIRASGTSEPLVVDEVGPLELEGGGLWPALGEALGRADARILLVVREELVADVTARLAPPRPSVVDLRQPDAVRSLERHLFGKGGTDDRQG
jgi:nucleoside-triphosphatase THEP1